MKTINLAFEDDEFKRATKLKKEKTWKKYILGEEENENSGKNIK